MLKEESKLHNQRFLLGFLLVCSCFISTTYGEDRLKKPNPEKIPFVHKAHGEERVDNYQWLRDDTRKNKKVLSHLRQENKYLENWFKNGQDLRSELFEEIVSRIPKKEDSVPVKMGSYTYFRRYEPDQEHAIYIRTNITTDNQEVILDVNNLAKSSKFYRLANWNISPSEDLLALAEDKTGRRQYEIRIKNLQTGKFTQDKLVNTSGDIAWSSDSDYIFYIQRDPVTLLPYRVLRHKLGDEQEKDKVIYEEKDNTFYLSLGNSRTMNYIEIQASSSTSSETLLIPSDKPLSKPKSFQKRQKDHLYWIEDDGDRFLIQTNLEAKNFKIMQVSKGGNTSKTNWKNLIQHNKSRFLESVLTFPSNFVLIYREDGLKKLRIYSRSGSTFKSIKMQDPSYSLYLAANPEYNSSNFNFGYTSMRVPDSIYSASLNSGRKKLLKQAKLKTAYDPSLYRVKRLKIKSRDGTTYIPVSLVYKKTSYKKGKNPLFIYGYGSYGNSLDAGFSSTRLSLLDRGYVFAIAHIRGGQEMGREWYEQGKMFKKLNTFYDFIDVTKGLVKRGVVDPDNLFAAGGSAGGLLMGAVINFEPNLYKAIISNVPFVDVVTTMSDPSIPLTTGEYNEWGNPGIKKQYDYMMKYSPYDNVDTLNYPSILVTTGLWDSQVQYYEPAKYVAKLRDFTTSDNPILMKVNMSAGHGGVSGRFASLEEVAMEYAFIIRQQKERKAN